MSTRGIARESLESRRCFEEFLALGHRYHGVVIGMHDHVGVVEFSNRVKNVVDLQVVQEADL